MEGFERSDDGDSMKDKISDLPNSLKDRILDRLSFEDAVKTCVLSKRWRYCWTRVRRIIFDKCHRYGHNIDLDKRRRLKGIINSTLLRHEGPIHEFVVCGYLGRDYLTRHPINAVDRDIHRWMQLLIDNGIQRLKFLAHIANHVSLPSRILNCSTLTHLSLKNSKLGPPEDFMGVGNLVDLRLSHVFISDRLLETIITSSALLTFLALGNLYFCSNGGCIVINAPFLKELHLCQVTIPPVHQFSLLIPKIEILKIHEGSLTSLASGDDIPMKLPSMLQKLKDLEFFNFDMRSLDHMAYVFCLLQSSPNLQSLSISVSYPKLYFLDEEQYRVAAGEFYDAQEGEGISTCLSDVKFDKLVGYDCEVRFISSLLKYCTFLETVSVSPASHFPHISKEQFFEKCMKL